MADNLELALRIKAAVDGLGSVQSLLGEISDLGGETEQTEAQAKGLATQLDALTNQQRLIEQFRQTKTQSRETAQAFEAAQTSAAELGRELAQTDNPTKKLRTAFEKARKESKRLEQADQDQRLALQSLRQEMGRAGVETRDLAGQQRRVESELDDTRQAADRLNGELEQQRDELTGVTRANKGWLRSIRDVIRGLRRQQDETEETASDTRSLRGTIIGAAGAFAAFLGAGAILEGIKRGLLSILQTGGRFEILEKQMTAIMGSYAEGQKAVEWIKQFAKTTPLQLEEVTRAFIQLKNFGLDPTNGTLQALVDQNAELGGSSERLRGIVSALGQAFAKQRLQTEEILQLVERGVPAYELLAKVTGKTGQALQDLIESGQLGRKTIKALIDEIGRSASGAAAAQMSTLQGLVSNVQDTYTQFLDLIAQAGVLDYFKGKLQELLDTTKRLAAEGKLKEYAQGISDAIVSASKAVVSWLGDVETVIARLETGASVLSRSVQFVYSGIGLIVNAVQFAGNTIGEVISGILGYAVRGADLVAAALAKVGLVSDQAAQKVHLMYEAFRDANAAYDKAAKEAFEGAKQSLAGLADAFTTSGDAASTAVEKITASIDELLAAIDKADSADALQAMLARLNAEMEAGTITSKQYMQAIEALTQKQDALAAATDKAATAQQNAEQATDDKAAADQQAKAELDALNDSLDDNARKYVQSGKAANYAKEQTEEMAASFEAAEHSAEGAAAAISAMVNRTQAYFRDNYGEASVDVLNRALHQRGNDLDDFLRISERMATLAQDKTIIEPWMRDWALQHPETLKNAFPSQLRELRDYKESKQAATQRIELSINGPTERFTLYADDEQAANQLIDQLNRAGLTAQ